MTAETQPRSLTVTIAGTSWSEYLVDLTVSFDSYSQGSGLILKHGTLRLCNIRGGRTLDPRIQSSFNVGDTLTIVWNGSLHPIAGSMRILAPPSVDLIDDSLPAIEGNFIVSIPIGCNLAYWKTNEADDDKTGVTLGNPLGLEVAVANLIRASSPSESKAISISSADYDLEFSYSKNGGSFIDLAGEFWYASKSQYPSALYCNQSGTIVSKNIQISGLGYSTFILLGTNDREYLPQLDSSFAPGIVRIAGVKRNVTDTTLGFPYTDGSIEHSQAPVVELSKVETTYNRGDNRSNGYNIDGTIAGTIRNYRYFDKEAFSLSKNIPRPPKLSYFNSTIIESKLLGIVDSREFDAQFYSNPDRLVYTVNAKFSNAKAMYPSGWEDIGDNAFKNSVIKYANVLYPSEITIVQFKFNGDFISERTTSVFSNLFLIDRNADFETEFDFAFAEGMFEPRGIMLLKQQTIEKWKRLNNRYLLSVTSSVPRIVNNPAYVSELTDAAQARNDRYLLQSKLTRSQIRNQEPPSITYWSGKYTIEEENLGSSVTFGTGSNNKEIALQMPFVFAKSQLDFYAKIEGGITNGRQNQYLVECQPSLFSAITEPLSPVAVTEPSQRSFFLADALTWYHTANEDYVGFAGIYTGSSGSTSATFPSQFPQNQIVSDDLEAAIGLAGTIRQEVVTGVLHD